MALRLNRAELEIAELAMTVSHRTNVYESIKPRLDFVVALVMLLFTAPIILFIMVLTRLSSPGPMIFAQSRLGLGARVFTMYKIRTMYDGSERHCGAVWCLPGDRRVTPLGRLLRWCHLDELPQLINVLMGEMSLVGPRPERPEFLDRLEREFPEYRRRMSVRPGVTGLAQVRLPADTELSGVRSKLKYDLYYVDRASPWLDFRVILGTVLKCLGVPFLWIGRILRLPDLYEFSSAVPASGTEPNANSRSRESDLREEVTRIKLLMESNPSSHHLPVHGRNPIVSRWLGSGR